MIYLGTARDLIASLIADMLECGVLGPSTIPVKKRLRQFSIMMNRSFKEKKPGAHRIVYDSFLFALGWFGGKSLGSECESSSSQRPIVVSMRVSLNLAAHGKLPTSRWFFGMLPKRQLNTQRIMQLLCRVSREAFF